LLLLLFVNVPVLAQVEKYSSKGKLVRIDWFRPLDDKGKPIVLILYGASGGGDSDYFSGCAQQFADAGFVAGVVHYFDSVNIKRASPTQMTSNFRDSTVSLLREKRTEAQLRQLNSPFEVHIYPKQGHCFEPELAQDAVVRTIAFFENLAK